MRARFEGEVVVKWLHSAAMGDGRDRCMELLGPFVFWDKRGDRWEAPGGSLIDGASIPRFFWRIVDPYIGPYRRASVIHDVYCKTKAWPSWQVHRMFYEAMLCGGTPRWKALFMWAAVRTFGPRFGGRGR